MNTINFKSKYLFHFLKPFLIFVLVGAVLGRNMLDAGNLFMAVAMAIGLGLFVSIKESGR